MKVQIIGLDTALELKYMIGISLKVINDYFYKVYILHAMNTCYERGKERTKYLQHVGVLTSLEH